MVSQEEYEYSKFKCAFCKALNPAKKIRPIAPRLTLPEKSATGEANNKPLPSQSHRPNSSVHVTDKDSGNITQTDSHEYRDGSFLLTDCIRISKGSESDAVTNEIRKRKQIMPAESDESAIDTIPKPESELEPELQPTATHTDDQTSNTNNDEGTESNESVKTQTDKKNE